MADLSFYKYLEAAFRYRLNSPQGKTATLNTRFNYLGYNFPYQRIFYYARRLLPKFYTGEFPDTEQGNLQMARKVLEKLERRQDQELENQFKGVNVSQESQQIIQEAKSEAQTETAQQPAAAGAPAGPITGSSYMPSAPSALSMPRIIHNIPQTELPPAVKGGRAVTAKAERLAAGEGKAVTAKAERLQTAVPKAFADAFKNEPDFQTDPTKFPAQPAPKRGAVTDKAGRMQTIATNPGIRYKSGFTNTFKNFTSSASRFFKGNVGKYLTLGRAATGVGAVIGGFAGAGLSGGASMGVLGGAIGGGILPSWVRSGGGGRFFGRLGNGIINSGARLSNQVAGWRGAVRNSAGKLAEKRVAIRVIAVLIFGGVLGAGLLGAVLPGGSTTPGGTSPIGTTAGTGCPDTSTNRSDAACRYLNPSINIFDTGISQSAVDLYINKYSPIFINAGQGDLSEFTKRVNYIVSNSQAAGLNPAMFLGYWKTESNFSTVGSRHMGCVGDNFYEQVDCALGINKYSNPVKNPIANCARSRDANSVACRSLKSIRQTFDATHQVKYPVATFDDFAESYGPYNHLSNGLHTNCTHTYNELINVSKELSACTATAVGSAGGGMTNIVNFAGQLTQVLKKGANGLFHIKPDEPSVYYWCTYLIIDSYKSAGFAGLTRLDHAGVLSMKAFFTNTSGYKLLPPQTPVGQLQPGNVIFFEGSNNQHASLIKLVDIDSNGNGVIKTYDANNIFTEDSVDVKNFQAVSARTTSQKYAITGFGQITQ